MRILWVTPQLPSRRTGGQVRQYYLLRYLCQRHQVTVLSLVQPAETGEVRPLHDLGIEVIPVPFAPPSPLGGWRNRMRSWSQLLFDPWPCYARTYPLEGLRKRLRDVLRESPPDILDLEHLFSAPLGNATGGRPWALVEYNIESRRTERQVRQAATPARRLAGWIEMQKIRRWERLWARRATVCIAVSEADADELRAMAPDTPVFIVPNGVDTAHFAPPKENPGQRAGLLFFGNLGYSPNADAVAYFCREIFPLIRLHFPEVTLSIVGPNAPQEVVTLGELPGIHYVGFVEDIRPYLWSAFICVVPLRVGGGTRLKILEAMAAECPVVSTPIGAEGLDLLNERDLLIAETPSAFASRVLDLLRHPDRCRDLAEQGRKTVAGRYDWRVIAPCLEEAYAYAFSPSIFPVTNSG